MNDIIKSASRKDLQLFHAWLKTLPWKETHFLFQTYYTEDVRQQKTIELFTRWLKEKDQKILPSQSGRTTPLTPPSITPPSHNTK